MHRHPLPIIVIASVHESPVYTRIELTFFLPCLKCEALLPFPEDAFSDDPLVGLDGDTLLLFDDSSESDRAPFFSFGSGRTSRAGLQVSCVAHPYHRHQHLLQLGGVSNAVAD